MRGINIDNIWDDKLERKLQAITGEQPTARIVVDNPFFNQMPRLLEIVPMVKKYADVMIQIQDSYGEKTLGDRELYVKASALFETFEKDCKLWEVGNEVNGDWCSTNIVERVNYIYAIMPEDAKALLTLFWDGQGSLIEWYKTNPIKAHYVGISFYPRRGYEVAFNNLKSYTDEIVKINPDCKVLISECGFEEYEENLTWRSRPRLRKEIEHPIVNHPSWVGGGFFWNGLTEGF